MTSLLVDFFLRTVFGLWILILLAAALLAPLAAAFRTWTRSRRYRLAQAAKLQNPDNAEARWELAQIYFDGGRNRAAERFAREAVEIAGRSQLYNGVPYRFLVLLGATLYRRRTWEEARGTFERALKAKADAGYFDALLGLSKTLRRLGRAGEAADFAVHAIRENNSSLEAYFRWAQSAAEAGKDDDARRAAAGFWQVRATLPPFARQRRLWFALAFLLFPLARRIG